MIIYKQVLQLTELQEIELPEYSEILTVQFQKDDLCMWYKFNEATEKTVKYELKIVGTGHTFTQNEFNYISTVQQGSYVWHIFERTL